MEESRLVNHRRLPCKGIWFTLFALAVTTAKAEQLLDGVVATVNSHPILYSEVTEKINKGPLVLISSYPISEAGSSYEKALHDLVNYRLIKDKATELEIEVSDVQVEERIRSLLTENNYTKDRLIEFLRQQGKTYDSYKHDVHDQMLFMRFKGRAILPRVKITQKDIESYYLKKLGSTSDSVELSLRQILIKIPANTDQNVVAQKEEIAKEVHRKLKGGSDFVEIEKIYSDIDDARSNKPPKSYRLKDFTPELRSELENLKQGEYSQPIKTLLGFHIFYLAERKFSGTKEFQEQREKLQNELHNSEIERQTQNWLTEERSRSKINILVTKL